MSKFSVNVVVGVCFVVFVKRLTMGHPHLQRLKTKLIESNERLEQSNCCIASLRAQYASLEAQSTENIALVRAQCARADVERDREAVCHGNTTERLTSVEAHNALLENMMLVESARQREREEQYNIGIQNIQRVARAECNDEIRQLRRAHEEFEEEIRWLRSVQEENKRDKSASRESGRGNNN